MDLDSAAEDATAYRELVPVSGDEAGKFDETEDRITAPEYAIKQEFSQEIYESHEKNIWLFGKLYIPGSASLYSL